MKKERLEQILEQGAQPKGISEHMEAGRRAVRRARLHVGKDWQRTARYLQMAAAWMDEVRRSTDSESTIEATFALDRAALRVWRKLKID